jgi:alpha-glucosidase
MLLLTLRGTPTLYNGDELGLENVPIPPGRERDPFGIRQPGTGQGRDPVRTPIPWDGSANCGFTKGEPWLPLGADHATRSVEAQKHDACSMLALTRALLDLRRREPGLSLGDWTQVDVAGEVLAYARTRGERRVTVVLNLAPAPRTVRFAAPLGGRIALSTAAERSRDAIADRLELAGDEGVIILPER